MSRLCFALEDGNGHLMVLAGQALDEVRRELALGLAKGVGNSTPRNPLARCGIRVQQRMSEEYPDDRE